MPNKHPDDAVPTGLLHDRVHAELVDAIRLGAFALGQRLPSENALAQKFSVSRPVVRAALDRLRSDGLVESRKGSGSFVCDAPKIEGNTFRPLRTVEDFSAYFNFRRLIESETAAAAAQNMTDARSQVLQDHIANMLEENTDLDNAIAQDFAFHLEIARISGNRFLVGTLEMLHPYMVFFGKLVLSLSRKDHVHNKQEIATEHRAIVDALVACDPVRARYAMSGHIRATATRAFDKDLERSFAFNML